MRPSNHLWSPAVGFATLLASYVVVGKLALYLASAHPSATPVWPTTGIAIAALVLGGHRLWPAIFVGAFVVNVTTAGSFATSLGIAGGNALEALVGAHLVRRFANGRDAFRQPSSIFAFCLVAGCLATTLSATLGVASLALGGHAAWRDFGRVWLTWWLGNAGGALVVAPFLVVWATERRQRPDRGRLAEMLALAVTIVAVGFVVFGDAAAFGSQGPFAFLCLPPLVWAAYRFGPRGAVTAMVVVGAIATAGTLRGGGPFALEDPNESLLVLQLFLVTMSGTVLPLAALARELSDRAEASAENARLYRESEGRRRTADVFLETSRALLSSLDIRHVAERIVASVRALLGGTVAIVYRIDAATGAYEALAVAGDAGPDFTGAFTIPAGVGTIGLAVREQRAVITSDLTVDPRILLTPEVRTRLARAPHRAVLAVPLVSDGTTLGAFLVGDQAGRIFSDEEIVVAEVFAQHAALAIANARRFEEERRARAEAEAARTRAEEAERQLTTLGEIAHSISASLDLDIVLQRIARGAQELTASDTAAIFLRDGDTEAMVPRYRVGPAIRAYDGLRILPGQGMGGHVLLTGRALRTVDYAADPRVPAAFHAIARETGTVTLMVVPIALRARVEGLLYISNRTGRAFTERDEAVCMRLAEQAAAAIRNAQLFTDVKSARAEAEAASRAKDDFLAVLSHELRTPLNAIVGWTRMLLSGSVAPEATRNAIQVIDRNAAAQTQLVEDLLDVSRIISGTLSVELQPVKLAHVIAAALDAVRPAAERKRVRLVCDVAPAVDCVQADRARLQQVIGNLLVNAVKFTPPDGRVHIAARADAQAVEITVSDTGCGIDATTLPYIFDRFRQADSSTTRQHGGLGLGLALVKHIVELHGGTVSAASDGPGTGARFTVRLAHATDPATDRLLGADTTPVRRANLSGVTVLVVEDDSDARELCAQALAAHDAVVTTAASVGEALEAIDAVRPAVIIADLGIPGEDGFALIGRLRADERERGRRMFVIALTAYVGPQDRRRVLDAGFDAHVAKPYDPAELATMIERVTRYGWPR